jgi:hypothetical protein
MESLSITAISAALIGAAGVGALRVAWRSQGWRHRALMPAGWIALALCLYFWSLDAGTEFGVSYALAWIALCALALIAAQAQRRPRREEITASGSTFDSSAGHKWLTFIAAGPLAALACCQLTLVLVYLSPLHLINQMALAALLYPILWGIAAYLSCYYGRPGRNALVFIFFGCASSLLLL